MSKISLLQEYEKAIIDFQQAVDKHQAENNQNFLHFAYIKNRKKPSKTTTSLTEVKNSSLNNKILASPPKWR